MKTETWLAEIGKVADELGYGITLIEPARIELIPSRGGKRAIRITLDGERYSPAMAEWLRTYLRKLPERERVG